MIIKVVCDRCGKEIEDSEKERILYSAVTAKTAMIHIPSVDGEDNCYIDLCPDCTKSFHAWMHSVKDETSIDLTADLDAELSIPED